MQAIEGEPLVLPAGDRPVPPAAPAADQAIEGEPLDLPAGGGVALPADGGISLPVDGGIVLPAGDQRVGTRLAP